MKKRILGLVINPSEIGWALIEQEISDIPEFPKSNIPYEIKEDKYIVDSTGEEVIVFNLIKFENSILREKFKNELHNKTKLKLIGADSKETTGLFYSIFTDKVKDGDSTELMTKAIKAMDWFIDIIN